MKKELILLPVVAFGLHACGSDDELDATDPFQCGAFIETLWMHATAENNANAEKLNPYRQYSFKMIMKLEKNTARRVERVLDQRKKLIDALADDEDKRVAFLKACIEYQDKAMNDTNS